MNATSDAFAGGAARLQQVRVDPGNGLHIGSLCIGRQHLRVGIRPASRSAPGERRPPLLLFNGIGANMELTWPLLQELSDRELIVFDVPGAGASPAPRLPYRMWQLALLARRLLDELGYEVIDCGHLFLVTRAAATARSIEQFLDEERTEVRS